ncbi:MAG: GH116 family glycosyl-hydrolase [Chthonomonadales bacterium]
MGGFGTGSFCIMPSGEFRRWHLHPGEPVRDEDVAGDRFHVWISGSDASLAATIGHAEGPYAFAALEGMQTERHVLFPLTWMRYKHPALPVQMQSIRFSPVIPGALREASLPVHVIVWRVLNCSPHLVECSLMLTLTCRWPHTPPQVSFDLQHDNLCITGALGDPNHWDRIAVAVPDLHSEGVYLQGIEPWNAQGPAEELWTDFAEDGELEPQLAKFAEPGAAAWVKFALEPGEAKDLPFVIMWHLPIYRSGPAKGAPRYYTQFLRKRRPDNAVVWLAEEALEDFGQEWPNWRYWLFQIMDWHASLAGDPRFPLGSPGAALNLLAALLEGHTVWTDEDRFHILANGKDELQRLARLRQSGLPIHLMWPHVAKALEAIAAG